jgi:hypothetical protein
MPSVVNTRPVPVAPVIPDFGWYYGITPTRLPEKTYQEGTATYPPGMTTLASATTFNPTSTTPFSFSVNTPATSVFNTQSRVMIQDPTTYHWALVKYTGTTLTSGLVSQFTGCLTIQTSTGSSIAFSANAPVFDRRFYVDQAPLNQLVTFDTQDTQNFGLRKTVIPAGITVRQYFWDFGNGETAYGPQASTTYKLNQTPPIQVTLTVTDSLDREFSVAHPINLYSNTQLYGTSWKA